VPRELTRIEMGNYVGLGKLKFVIYSIQKKLASWCGLSDVHDYTGGPFD